MKGLVGVPIGNSPDTKLTSITKSINFLFEIKFLSTFLNTFVFYMVITFTLIYNQAILQIKSIIINMLYLFNKRP